MSTPNPTPPLPAAKRRLLIASGIGAAVIVVGAVLPRVLSLPSLDQIAPASSADDSPAHSLVDGVSPETRALIERSVIGVSAATLLLVGVGWLVRRRRNGSPAEGPQLLNVTAALTLPNRCCAFLIEVGDRQFLAGVDVSGIRSVIPLPGPPEEANAAAVEPMPLAPKPVFLEVRA